MTANLSVTAKFAINTYALTVTKAGTGTGLVTGAPAGIDCGATCSQSYDYNTVVTLTATPGVGSTFTGWTGACTGVGTCVVTTDAAKAVTATFTLNSYTVSFDSNSGTAVTSQVVAYGSTATAPTTPTRTGYTFAGWYSDLGLTAAFSFTTAITTDLTLYAKWTAASQTLSFDSNGGSAVAAITQDFGTAVTAPAAPTKTGYSFAGWYTDNLTFLSRIVRTMGLSSTIYAKWTATSQTLSFDSNGGSAVAAITQDFGTAVTAPAAPTKTGYSFAGWYTDNLTFLNAYSFGTMGLSSTIYAKWTINNYTVSFESNGGTAVGSQVVAYNGLATAPTAPTRTGYTFEGWYSDSDLITAFSFTTVITADLTLYAKWTINSYTVSFNSNGGTAVTSQVVAYGSTATAPTAPTRTGYTFAGWYSDSDLISAFSFTTPITTDLTLYAKWTINSYLLSVTRVGDGLVTSTPAGIDCGATCGASYDYNQLVTLTAAATVGSTFTGWTGACTGTGSCVVTMDAAKAVTATFTLNNYTVSFDSNGGTAVGSQVVAYNGLATAPPDPTRTGHTFAGWYSDSDLSSAFSFSTAITTNLTLYAKWTINNYTVSFDSNGGSSVGNQVVAYNGLATAPPAPTRTGYTFAGWYSDPGLISAFSFTTAITADLTLYAKWTINNYTVSFDSNGGTTVASQVVAYNGLATAPTDPTRTNYAFAGWYSDSGLTTAFSFTTAITADLTLYAKWTINNYTVSFDSNGGTTVASQVVAYNGLATAPPDPTRTGHTFAGWYSDPV